MIDDDEILKDVINARINLEIDKEIEKYESKLLDTMNSLQFNWIIYYYILIEIILFNIIFF